MSAIRLNISDGLARLFQARRVSRGATWGLMIVGALLAFEIFNFSTTQFALTDVLGSELKFAGFRWATILSIAFCGIDFAGIARIFTPEQGRDESNEVYYLFGAWLLAAGFNATLTWWGVSVAIVNHSSAGSGTLVSASTMTRSIPVFVAVMVWLIRVLIIGTFSMAGDRLFTTGEFQTKLARPSTIPGAKPASATLLRSASSSAYPVNLMSSRRSAPKPTLQQTAHPAPEPRYQSALLDARPNDGGTRRYDS